MKQKPGKKPFTILYAEDDPAIRDIVTRFLSRRYPDIIAIDTADNGATGLDLFRKSRHDLIITDNRMPLMSGVRMFSEIREISPDTPVIFLSASLGQGDFPDAPPEGAVHFLLKPFRASDLFDLTDRYIKIILSVGWLNT